MTLHWHFTMLPSLFAGGVGLALGFTLLWASRPGKVANACLSVVILVTTFLLEARVLFHEEHLAVVPTWLAIPLPFAYLIPAGLWLYVRKSTRAEGSFKATDALHLLPFLLACLVVFPVNGSVEARFRFFERAFFGARWFHLAILDVVIGIYLLASEKEVSRFHRHLQCLVSNELPYHLGWLRTLLASFWAITLWLTGSLLTGLSEWGEEAMVLTGALVLFLLAFYALKQSPLFWETGRQLRTFIPTPPRYETSGITPKAASAEGQRLLRYFSEARPYLNSNLKLGDLAKALRVTEYQMSQIINMGLNENFYSLVNRFRVEAAMRRLREPDLKGRNILEIAYDCGFNSKSVFNTAFRKQTGLTPSEYRATSMTTATPSPA